MRYHYVASDAAGKIQDGDLDAMSPLEVLNFLGSQNLRPVSVKEAFRFTALTKNKVFGSRITIFDKIFLVKYLALMLRVGTDLFKALDILIADFDKPIMKALLMEIREALQRGQPFYTTFTRYPKYFSPVFINMVKAGEASGGLERTFNDLGTYLEQEKELKSRIKAALIYPTILLGLSVVILIFLVTFALPKIAVVFQGLTKEPPLFSRIVLGVGLFLNDYLLVFIIGGFVGGAAFIYFFFKNETGKRIRGQILLKTPVVKTLLKKIAIQRFASVLGSLMRAGLPIIEAMDITADAVDHPEVGEAIRRISIEGIAKGQTIGEAFKREKAFPGVVANLISISEKAGHLEEILKSISEFYTGEVDTTLKTLVAFIEPVLLLMIGGVVGLIALSIIVPIYQLVGQF